MGAIWAVYLLYLGLPIVMKTPQRRVVSYVLASVLTVIVANVVMRVIFTTFGVPSSDKRRYTFRMRMMARAARFLGVVYLTACSAACSTSAQAPHRQEASDIVATVGGTSISMADVDARALERPAAEFGSVRLSQALYEARATALDAIVGNMLLDAEAKARGTNRETLARRGSHRRSLPPPTRRSPPGIRPIPRARRARRSTKCREPIRQFLTEERSAAAASGFSPRSERKRR